MEVHMEAVNFVEFRKHLSEYVNQAQYRDELIPVTRHGKVVGGFVSADALHLLEEWEMKKDEEAFDRGMKSIKKHGTVSLGEFKKQIGL